MLAWHFLIIERADSGAKFERLIDFALSLDNSTTDSPTISSLNFAEKNDDSFNDAQPTQVYYPNPSQEGRVYPHVKSI